MVVHSWLSSGLNGRQVERPPSVARRTRFVLLDYYGTNQSAASRRKLRVLFLTRSHLRNRWHRKASRRQDAGASYKAPYVPFTRTRVICACEREEQSFFAASACVDCFSFSCREIVKCLLLRIANFRRTRIMLILPGFVSVNYIYLPRVCMCVCAKLHV